MSEKYKFNNPDGIYFVTITITEWVDLFTKPDYCNLILNSLTFCQKNKGLVIHAWCIMPSHLHLIISRNGELLLPEIIRDFKRYTSIEIIKTIENTNESRIGWLTELFSKAASRIKRVEKFKVWQDGNHPIELDSTELINQRLDYIHENPVKAGYVRNAVDYVYSSAVDYADEKGLLKLIILE